MISLIVATRYRPGQLAAMWRTAQELAADPGRVELVYRVDDDDPSGYAGVMAGLPGRKIRVEGPRMVLSQLWNDAAARAEGDLLWHGGDDNLFRTAGWDVMVAEAAARYADGIVFVHGRDGAQDEKIGTHGFVTRAWIAASGFFLPPYFTSDYNDTWLTEVADAVGRRIYLPGMLIEHMHPVWGKGEWDRNHAERLARHAQAGLPELWDSLAAERGQHADRLKEAIG